MADHGGFHGLMAEFHDPSAVVAAARRAYEAGYRRMDGYTPFPIEELGEALGWHTRGRLPRITLLGGLTGAIGGYALFRDGESLAGIYRRMRGIQPDVKSDA